MKIKSTNVRLSDSGQFSKLFLSYINKEAFLKPFYMDFPEKNGFLSIISNISFPKNRREVLADTLAIQYKDLIENDKVSEKTKANISLFKDEDCLTVCTGHQLCLFTGPLYFIYKIATTIKLTNELKSTYPNKNFVPVFWMASEDHDIEEINHVFVYGKKLTWNEAGTGAAGRLTTSTIKVVLDELRVIMGNSANADYLNGVFSNAYLHNDNLADATRFLVNELFGDFGLVIIDPDDKTLKRELIDIMHQDIFKGLSYEKVNESIKDLNSIGVKDIQVNPREINFFYLLDQRRERIEKVGENYSVKNTDILFTAEELKGEIELNPERFSPNVVLRPVYQQLILPNIAYVGGPGEIAYWLEYKRVFDTYDISYPLLVPRNFILWIEKQAADKLKKWNLEIDELFVTAQEFEKLVLMKNSSINTNINNEEKLIKNAFDSLLSKAIAIDQSLKATVEAEHQKATNSLNNIGSKIIKAAKQKEEVLLGQASKVHEKFFPRGSLQERHDNFIPFYIKYGKEWIEVILTEIEPYEFELKVLEEQI